MEIRPAFRFNHSLIKEREHILVCFPKNYTDTALLHKAIKMSEDLEARLTAVCLESDKKTYTYLKDCGNRFVGLAQMRVITMSGDGMEHQICAYIQESDVTKIIVGRPRERPFHFRRGLAEKLLEMHLETEIYVVPLSVCDYDYQPSALRLRHKDRVLKDTIFTLLILASCTMTAFVLDIFVPDPSNASMTQIYILGVLLISIMTNGKIYGVVASVISVLAVNFFYTHPIFSFAIEDATAWVALPTLFFISLITGTMAMRMKSQERYAARKAYRTSILLDMSQKLQEVKDADGILQTTAEQLIRLLGCGVAFIPNTQEQVFQSVCYCMNPQICSRCCKRTKEENLQRADAVLKKSGEQQVKKFWKETDVVCYNLGSADRTIGVAVFDINIEHVFETFDQSMIVGILEQCTLALEKEHNEQVKREMQLRAEQEKLRADLLRSISHDLRTPLTSILGNTSILLDSAVKLDDVHKHNMYYDIYEDAKWLINLVENLLSITRLEGGMMKINKQPELIDDVLHEALQRFQRESITHEIQIDWPEECLIARMESHLIIQVVVNLVDNAIKYTPKGSHIHISAERKEDMVCVNVADDGGGIAQEDKEMLFKMFVTLNNKRGDATRSMGLGLALCQTIIHAHNGEIWVTDNKPRGAVFHFTLPIEEVLYNEQTENTDCGRR